LDDLGFLGFLVSGAAVLLGMAALV
jgi:hypothetical protein